MNLKTRSLVFARDKMGDLDRPCFHTVYHGMAANARKYNYLSNW